METGIIFDNLTNVGFPGVRSAIAHVGEKTVCATLDNCTVYVDNQPRAYFYGCTGEQLQTLFYAVAEQLLDSLNHS